MGYGNIVMFAFREFFVEVIGKSLVPYTDIGKRKKTGHLMYEIS